MRKIFLTVLLALTLAFPASSADVIYSWNSNDKKIALTFDDGPHPVYTQEILEILEEYDIRATFFVIGQNLQYYGDLLQCEIEGGHEIGNHTYSHRNLRTLTNEVIEQEIRDTEEAVYDKIEYRTHLLRPPGGKLGEDLCRLAQEKDYTVVCWSVDTRDWAHTPSDQIAENVLSSVEGGDIILFHDFVSGDSPTPEALRIIIPVLLEEGYEFVTVSELIGSE